MDLKTGCFILLAIISTIRCQKTGDGYSCDFESDFCGLTNEGGNKVNWVRNKGSTPTPETGPSTDHTKSNSQGSYVFVNADALGYLERTTMTTETFDATSNSCLKFWYHMRGRHCGYLSITVVEDKTGRSTLVWERWFDQGDHWLQGQANIIAKESYRVEFEVFNKIEYDKFEGDIALDDVAIINGSCNENGDCNFEDDLCSWTNDIGNDFDWSRKRAGDVTIGPIKDHTSLSENSNFIYLDLDASTGIGKRSRLTKQFASTDVNGWCMRFWYYTVGSTGTITVYVDYGSTFPGEQPYWRFITGNPTNDWQEGLVPVVSEVDYQIIIEVVTGDDINGVVIIDDISFRVGWCYVSPESAFPPIDKTTPTLPPHVPTAYDCDFELGSLCTWTQPKDDPFDWTAVQAKNNRGHGPDTDYTRRSGDGWYIYIECEDQTVDDKAQLVSDVISASAQSCVTFWYHMYGTHVNKLSVYTKAKDATLTSIWLRKGGESDEWTFGHASISSVDDFQIVFEAECGSSYHGDIALDGILYMDGECQFPEHLDAYCDFEDPVNRLCGWKQEQDDDFDFLIGTGATRVHQDIGPEFDHTTRTENGIANLKSQ
ncbi:MAM and LDL-receptor class A domain-containing protein 1-like [Ptychodera flava]|uniref:MAM and LDL-receptor class A domain-containing protein 1-like n=1 Tax=Ptychodera flava TaxID=63121 RepID=UPI00396A1EB5